MPIPSIATSTRSPVVRRPTPSGVPVMPGRATKIAWMMLPADLLHYWLGFALLAVVLGHAAMAILHRRLWNEAVLTRMT